MGELKDVGPLLVDAFEMSGLFLLFLLGLALGLEEQFSAFEVLLLLELFDGLVDLLVLHFGSVDGVPVFLVDVLGREEVGFCQVDFWRGVVFFFEVVDEVLPEDVDDVVAHVALLEFDLVVVVPEEVVAVLLLEVQFLVALVVFEFVAVVFELVPVFELLLVLVVVLLV